MSVATARWCVEKPDELALADDRVALSWSQVDRLLDEATGALLSLDLGPDRRVAVFAENSAETVLAHLAGTLAGASTVPVSFHLTASEVSYILEDSRAAVLFTGPETAEVARKAAREAGVATVIGWRCEGVEGITDWEGWLDAAPPREPESELRPRPHLHYTSGTTGRPKGAETPPAMFAGGDTISEHVDLIRANPMLMVGGVSLVVSPLYHTGPLASIRGLFAGVSLAVLARFEAEATLKAIEQFGVTTTVMVPTHFSRLLALPDEVRSRYDLSSLVLVAHTGAACPVDVKRKMIDWWGPVLFEAYGATESGTTNAIFAAEWLEHPGSVGRTLPPFEVVVVDDHGAALGVNEVGRLFFRDTTGRGIVYHNDPEKTAAAHLEPGVFTLGEIGYVDADGYLFITDRSSDMVVSGGVNVYPAEAEAVLLRHPEVEDVACIGVPDDDFGEQLKALVVPASSTTPPSEAELLAFCRDHIASYKVPRSVEMVVDLGRNAMGKLNKRSLRAPYWPTERTIGG